MANITLLPSAKVPLVYDGDNTMTTEWYRFFWNIYGFTGTGVVPVNKGGTGLDTIGDHQLIIGNANNVFEPASLSSASIAITYPAGFVNLELGTSGVTAGTYGSASQVGVFTVNAYGVLTAASNTSIGIDANQIISGTLPVTRGGTGATTLTGYVKGNGTSAFTASATVPTTDLSGTITNAQLANSTISGVALGGNLFNLTAGTGVSFSAGTTYNGSTAITINATGSGGTVTSVTGTAPVVSSGGTTPAISMAAATGSVNGYLTSTDWTTFNGKAPGVTFTTGYVPFGQGTTTLNQSANLTFDGTNLIVAGTGKFGTTVGVGAATPSTSGAGITFPATQSASTNANTLDDYEEGTWTPALSGNTSISGQAGTFTGKYTKVGNLVTCSASCVVTTAGTFTGTYVVITGLPFAPNADYSGHISYYVALNRAMVNVGCYAISGQTRIAITGNTAASVNLVVGGFLTTDITNTTQISASVTYTI